MKGLADILGKGAPKGVTIEAEPAGEEEESGGSELEFARLASEASAAGDHDAAAEALVSAIKACMTDYGPSKPAAKPFEPTK